MRVREEAWSWRFSGRRPTVLGLVARRHVWRGSLCARLPCRESCVCHELFVPCVRLVSHPRPLRVRAPVYRGCPAGTHRGDDLSRHDDEPSERQPRAVGAVVFSWLLSGREHTCEGTIVCHLQHTPSVEPCASCGSADSGDSTPSPMLALLLVATNSSSSVWVLIAFPPSSNHAW